MSKIYSATQSASALGISKVRMGYYIRQGFIPAQNIGTARKPIWAVHAADLERLHAYIVGDIDFEDPF